MGLEGRAEAQDSPVKVCMGAAGGYLSEGGEPPLRVSGTRGATTASGVPPQPPPWGLALWYFAGFPRGLFC